MQRGPKAKPSRATFSMFWSDCHLPAMIRLTEGHDETGQLLDSAGKATGLEAVVDGIS